MTTFEIDFHGSVQLTVAQVWPDGDAPEHPTVKDVLDVIVKDHGGRYANGRRWVAKDRLLVEWDLLGYVGIRITGPGGSEEVP